jgi:hypothetical protein
MNENISVWLTQSKQKRIFRCVNCGKIVFEYYGNVRLIVAGEHEVDFPTIIQCKGTIEKKDWFGQKFSERCHTKYIVS